MKARTYLVLFAVTVISLGILSLGVGGPSDASTHPPDPSYLPHTCAEVLNNAINRWVLAPNPAPGCVDETKGVTVWAPLKGAVWDTKLGWMLHGQQMTEGDVLRVPSGPFAGRARLFIDDVLYDEGGQPSPDAKTASAGLGLAPLRGLIEVTPAPMSMYPIKPGSNSLGWTTTTGP